MADQQRGTPRIVWGIPVPVGTTGRCRWPDEIRVKARERLAAGDSISTLMRETGVGKSILARWAREGGPAPAAVGFVEVKVAAADRPKPAEPSAVVGPVACRLRLADVDLFVPDDFPTDQLTAILRAVRESQ